MWRHTAALGYRGGELGTSLTDSFVGQWAGTNRWVSQDQVSRAVVQMEANGFALDSAYCHETAARARQDEERTLEDLYRWSQQVGLREDRENTDLYWSSSQKLIRFLHDDLGLPRSPVMFKGRVKDGKTSVDATAVEWIAAHVNDKTVRRGLNLLLDLRKTRSSVKYLEKLPKFVGTDGLIHPVCGPAGDEDDAVGAVTWRLAMKKPEGQQIPKSKKKDRYGVRRAIVPRGPGRLLVSNDYTALEVVILAHLCALLFDDYSLAKTLAPGAPDFHSTNAREVFGRHLDWVVPDEYAQPGKRVADFGLSSFKAEEAKLEHPFASWLRDVIKAVWYGLQYRKASYGFGWTLKDQQHNPIGEKAASAIVEAMYTTVPVLQRLHAHVDKLVLAYQGVAGLNGCWCDLSDLVKGGNKWSIARAQRRGSNYPCQQGGAAIIGPAMVNVLKNKDLQRMGYVLSLQVHDQLVGDCPAEHAEEAGLIVQHEMENAFPLLTKLQASRSVGPNLLECR